MLDPRTLGRPVHLLPRFTLRLGESLGELFRQFNRRYRAQYQLGDISLKPALGTPAPTGRWLLGETALGRVACLVERRLLLSLMAHRYGSGADETQVLAGDEAPPETATEERLLALLGRQLLERVLGLLEIDEVPALESSLAPRNAPGCWSVQIPVSDGALGLESEIVLLLDAPCIDLVLKRLSEGQVMRKPQQLPQAAELPRQLTLTLKARLLEQTLPLGELLDLRPGTVLPVRLKATEVLVDGSRLFTAAVAEHQGKLCLTSFADAE